MKPLKALSTLIVILIIAAACASTAEPESTSTIILASPTPSATDQPTATASPTATITPTPTQTATITLTPSQTATSIPYTTNTPIFPIYTQQFNFETTPTPIATPISREGSYQLAPWNPSEAVDLIHQADEYIYSRDFPGFAENRITFKGDQIYAELAVQEALLFFPNSEYEKQLRWKLANIHAVQDKNDSDKWVVSALEEGLNNHLYSPSSIKDVLAEYGFEIEDQYEIPNLFGDGKTIQVIAINTQHIYTFDGILIAIREISPGIYNLELLDSMWNFYHGAIYVNGYEDLNKNDIPEVFPSLEITATGADICWFNIVEWNGTEFIKLTKNEDEIPSASGCNLSLDSENQTIKVPGSWHSNNFEIYQWNGEVFELDQTIYDYLSRPISDSFEEGNYSEAIQEIEAFFDGSSSTESIFREAEIDKPTSRDFLRFILGLAYIYDNDITQGKQVFQDLVANPISIKYPYISQAAEAYLATLNQTRNQLFACKSAIDVFTAIPGYPDGNNGRTNLETIGLPNSYYANIRGYCYNYPMEILENIINENSQNTLADIFEKNGIDFQVLASFDYGNDNHTDLVFAADLFRDNHPDTFIAIWHKDRWLLHELPNYQIPSSPIDVSLIESTNNEDPFIRISMDEEAVLLKIIPSENSASIERLLETMYSDEFNIDMIQNSIIPEFYTYGFFPCNDEDYYCETIFEWSNYYWDQNQGELIEKIYAETLIFEEHRYLDAIQVLQADIAAIKPYYQEVKAFAPSSDPSNYYLEENITSTRAKLLYLLGLAYQLNGNDDLAAERFYQVWQEHPDTGYAIMARGKLAPID